METTYCLFKINNVLNAINTDYLGETFALPELILVPNAPSGIVGVLDVRGEVLPVVDLRPAAEGDARSYSLTDSILTLKQQDLHIGLIVNSVQGMRELSTRVMAPLPADQHWMDPDIREIFAGMLLNEHEIFILNEPQSWFNPGELQQVIAITRFLVDDLYTTQADQTEVSRLDNSFAIPFCPDATPQEKSIFRQRAENLRLPAVADGAHVASQTLIVITLNNNLLGIDANAVREFITIEQAVPVPCCPRHIIGNTNLRGEVLTVLDISEPLGLEPHPLERRPTAVVIEQENVLVAVVVEDIRDALFEVKPSSIEPSPTTLPWHSYGLGVVPYDSEMMTILDLPKLLSSDALVVNELA